MLAEVYMQFQNMLQADKENTRALMSVEAQNEDDISILFGSLLSKIKKHSISIDELCYLGCHLPTQFGMKLQTVLLESLSFKVEEIFTYIYEVPHQRPTRPQEWKSMVKKFPMV